MSADRSSDDWPYTGPPCETCGKRLDGPTCWPCNYRLCARCGKRAQVFFCYCWLCEVAIGREELVARPETS